MSRLEDELEAVQKNLNQISDGLHPALSDFIMDEVRRRADLDLAQIVLTAAYPAEDSEIWQQRRVQLAGALELLAVALTIHKLLLTDLEMEDTVDKSLAGGTVLAGDLCFSRAASMAARTQSPEVVAIFAELLQLVSEGNLRTIVRGQGQNQDEDQPPFSETALLYQEGARAGAVLAQLPLEAVETVAQFGRELAMWREAREKGNREAPTLSLSSDLPPFQQTRWQALLTDLPS